MNGTMPETVLSVQAVYSDRYRVSIAPVIDGL